MSIPSVSRSADLPVNIPPTLSKGITSKAVGEGGASSEVSVSRGRVQASTQLNTAIVQSSLSLSSQNEPLALVLKSAITGINERLAPDFGPDAIQNATGQDNSPEGTAGRIVALSTAFFGAFKEQNPELSEEAAAQKFLDTIKGGIEQGFKEAREILDSLKVLNGDVASNIDKTFDLVQQGLAKFAASLGIGKDDTDAPEKPDNGNADNQSNSQSRIEVSIRETRSTTITISASTGNAQRNN